MTFDEEVDEAYKKWNYGYLNKDMRYTSFYNGYKMAKSMYAETKFYIDADENEGAFFKYYLSNGVKSAKVNIIADCYDDLVEIEKISELPPNIVEVEKQHCYGNGYIVTGYFNDL